MRSPMKHLLVRRALVAAALAALCACSRDETAPIPPPAEQPTELPTAAVHPPPWPSIAIDRVRASERLAELEMLTLGDFTIRLGRTMMSDVVRTIGAGVLDEAGDGADYMGWYCYTLAGRGRIWLVSAEMGTGDLVTQVRAVADPAATPERRCPALPARFARIAIYPDVWLGASAAQIARLYGPLDAEAPWTLYSRERHISSDNLAVDERRQLAVRIENGRVVELRASKVQLY